jgi:hypothetical protein
MPSICLAPVGGNRMRATKLDSCGVPLTGVDSCQIITEGFTMVERTAEYADPDQFVVKNAGGKVCIKHRRGPQFLWLTFNINFCEVDPEMYSLMSGAHPEMNDEVTPEQVGWRTRDTTLGTTNWALELWTELSGMECEDDNVPYGYYLAPWIVEGTIGTPTTFENGPVSFNITGARTKGGTGWGVGPYDVINTALGIPSPLLSAMTAADHDLFRLTTLAPPDAACGCQTVTP